MPDSKNDVALVVFACDRYELLYKGFEYTFNKYWNRQIECKKFFVTEYIDTEVTNFENIKSGTGAWSDRVRKVLENLNEKYIIFFQEDMWLNVGFDANILNKVINHTIEKDIKLVKLHATAKYVTQPTGQVFNGLVLSKLDKSKSRFIMSHQVSFWERRFLIEQLKFPEDPWMNERKGTKRLKKSEEEILQIDLFRFNDEPFTNNNPDTKGSGVYQTVSYDAVIAKEASVFFKEFEKWDSDYAKKIAYNMNNDITHDGKEKPRTKGIIRKLKRELKYQLNKFG